MTAASPPYCSLNPATGVTEATFPHTTDAELRAAIESAHAAYLRWRRIGIDQRAHVLTRIAVLFEERSDELGRLASVEMGKPLPEAIDEVRFCADIFRYFGDGGPSLLLDQAIPSASPGMAIVQRRPIGVLLGVMPWNYPYYQVARFAAPNFVVGNTMLLKHAESVPQCALAIAALFADAEVPEGVYANVFATHGQVESIVADERVQGVSLTGSERAGSAVAALAGIHLKKCVLELGGSDPFIVLDSDDPAKVAQLAWDVRVANTGQACNANKRMIVTTDIYDAYVDELTRLASGLLPGDPLQWTTGRYAPMSSRAAAERLDAQVQDAVGKGATLHAGGQLSDGPTAYYAPAVLTGVTSDMRAYREELFGPVAVVYRVDDDEQALALANDTVYGLGGAVFSSSSDRARALAEQLEVGMTNVNIPMAEAADMPFGGIKRSGFGRELGPLGVDEFVNKRLLYIA